MAPRAARPAVLLAAVALGFFPVVRAAEVRLNEVVFDGRSAVDIPFVATVRAPAGATLEAEVRPDGARTRLVFSWRKMKPAILFGGNVTSYVAWAVARDGAVESLGELGVVEAKGEATLATARKAFGLLVTAETVPGLPLPSDVVLFTGGAPEPGKARSEPFTHAGLSGNAKPRNATIATLEWTHRDPVELVKARTLVALAEAAKGDRELRALPDARAALGRAEASWVREGAKAPAEEARLAAIYASEALREAERRRAAEEAARLEAERKAKEAAERDRNADEADRQRQAEATLAEVEELRQQALRDQERTRLANAALAATTAQLEAERLALAGRQQELGREREVLAGRLADALGKVAPTEETPRGLLVVIPGASFEAGRSALTAAGRTAIGKLAGILLMVPERNVRVEGHSEPTKNAQTARKLAEERARDVADLLREQGVAQERIAFEGFGAERPVAPNTTAEGRTANRRLEIVVAEGTIEAPPPLEPAPNP